jgi:rRNA biogenesis protein RRP5
MALRGFREGDKVKAVILSVDTEKRRISFGLKPSYLADEDFEQEELEQEDEPQTLGVVEDESEEEHFNNEEGEEEADDKESEEDKDDMNVDVDMNVNALVLDSNQSKTGPSTTRSALKLDDGFQWSVLRNDGDVDMLSSEDNEEGQVNKKKKRKHKEIEQDLTADLQTKTPESNADFERVLLGSPNSSYLWIQYMSFQLQLAEVDKAREIAQRALKIISFREEQEKLNVWVALLNLENVYGTDESLESTFKEAARHNESKTVHLRMAAILDQSEKSEVWTLCSVVMMQRLTEYLTES